LLDDPATGSAGPDPRATTSTAPASVAADVAFAAEPPADWAGDSVTLSQLPLEALEALTRIASDGPFPYDQDGAVFQNREGILPERDRGSYAEYTVETPGSSDRGARRFVVDDDTWVYYTDDHYGSFRFVTP
jgi:ribonuclease T1